MPTLTYITDTSFLAYPELNAFTFFGRFKIFNNR